MNAKVSVKGIKRSAILKAVRSSAHLVSQAVTGSAASRAVMTLRHEGSVHGKRV
jgi:hypothetical protein